MKRYKTMFLIIGLSTILISPIISLAIVHLHVDFGHQYDTNTETYPGNTGYPAYMKAVLISGNCAFSTNAWDTGSDPIWYHFQSGHVNNVDDEYPVPGKPHANASITFDLNMDAIGETYYANVDHYFSRWQ